MVFLPIHMIVAYPLQKTPVRDYESDAATMLSLQRSLCYLLSHISSKRQPL